MNDGELSSFIYESLIASAMWEPNRALSTFTLLRGSDSVAQRHFEALLIPTSEPSNICKQPDSDLRTNGGIPVTYQHL